MTRVFVIRAALGPAGMLGIVVLLSCVPYYLLALQPLQHEVDAQRAAARRLRAPTAAQPAPGNELRDFYKLFPSLNQLPAQLARLYALARAAQLDLPQGEYRLEDSRLRLVAYRIRLPLRGSYPQLREFIAAVLKNLPLVSLDELRFAREKNGETQLDAQLRLTMYFGTTDEFPVK